MNRFLRNFKFGTKLACLAGGGIASVLLLSIVGWLSARALQEAEARTRQELRITCTVTDVANHVNRVFGTVGTLLLDEAAEAQSLATIADLRGEYRRRLDETRAMISTEEDRRLFADMEAGIDRFAQINSRVIELAKQGKRTEASTIYRQQAVAAFKATSESVEAYVRFRESRLPIFLAERANVQSKAAFAYVLFASLAILFSAVGGIILSRGMTDALRGAMNYLETVASGDISKDLPREDTERADEIGDLSRALQEMSNNLRTVLSEINEGIRVLSTSSIALSTSSTEMTEGSRKVSDEAHSVAAASEQMSTNAVSVAAGMEQTSSNLTNVATATGQMTSTIGEIAQNAEKARRVTSEAARKAVDVTTQMNALVQAAHDIGKVTETITEISSQTSLLALNATIEAARAGSAGKGFAVVAHEIKELAQQTAAATEDIKARVVSVQSSTNIGITEIEKIAAVTQDVMDLVTSIATAIEEQSAVTKDISRNITEASAGVGEVNLRVAQSSQATREIAGEIAVVHTAAKQMATSSEQVLEGVGELSKVAERLQSAAGRFHAASLDQEVIQNAVTAHAAWKNRLRSMIATGRVDTPIPVIRADDQCQFGRWLYSASLSPGEKQSPAYLRVKELHAQFHQQTAVVGQLVQSGKTAEATEAIAPASSFAKISAELTSALNNWTLKS